MLRRTLTVLTPALFALPFLLTPASSVYADADGMSSTYSGLECKYLETRWEPPSEMYPDGRLVRTYNTEGQRISTMEGQYMAGGDVAYHSRLGMGNLAPRTRDEPDPGNTAPAMGNTRHYSMTVGCPLPSLEGDDPMTEGENEADVVIVGAIDGTVFDDVTCRIQSCVVGLGIGAGGEGKCADGTPASTQADQAGFVGVTSTSPVTQGMNYITQNISWIRLEAPDMESINAGARNELPESQTAAGLGRVYSHLLCTLPEQDDVSPQAPGLVGQMRDEMGVSYIQSYYVDMEMN